MTRSVSALPYVFKICAYFQIAFFITLIRGYVSSPSIFRLTLFVTVFVLAFLPPAHAEKDLSLFEFFLMILTSSSSFVISESPVIAILILTDPSLISNIKPRLERFLEFFFFHFFCDLQQYWVRIQWTSGSHLAESNTIGQLIC